MDTRLLAGLLLLLKSFSAYAQPAAASPDSSSYRLAVSHTIAEYYSRAGDQANLYNGSVYPYYRFPFSEGSPFFKADSFSTGTLVYDGIVYRGVPLLYDDLREFLITINSGYWLRLVNERVSSFQVNGSRFLRIVTDSTVRNVLKTGYYEELYSGRDSVIKKTVKTYREDINDQTLRRLIDVKFRYYLRSGGSDYHIRSVEDLTDVFPDKKAELNAYRKKNHLRFRKQPETTIVMLVSYYDQIKSDNARQ